MKPMLPSYSICSPLIRLIIDNSGYVTDIFESISDQKAIKINVKKEKFERLSTAASLVRSALEPIPQLSMDLASEKGASIWLSTLPIQAQGFALTKSAFRGALRLRYNWPFPDTPSHCRCGKVFTTDHLLSCPTGGFPTI